jgi:hypothetical protein
MTDLDRAIVRLEAGLPVPVDIIARLVEAGIDYAAIERRYGAN